MKKIKFFTLITTIGLCAAMLFGCNKDLFDTNYTFDKAIIYMGSNAIPMVLDIKQWKDYEGEQLQLILADDSIVLVSSFNTILVKGEDSLIFKNETAEGKSSFYNYRSYIESKAEK